MDWALAIRRNRAALLAVVAAIVALLGEREVGPGLIARRIRNAALALLRPAESAARRLIVIAAQGLAVAPRPAPVLTSAAGREAGDPSRPQAVRPRAFRLFDRRKRHVLRLPAPKPAGLPRIRSFWGASPPAQPAAGPEARRAGSMAAADPEALVDIRRLRLRLAALERALADLPHQARRLARWRAGRGAERSAAFLRSGPASPLRLGRPPGWRGRPGREVDLTLRECHGLALAALRADTS